MYFGHIGALFSNRERFGMNVTHPEQHVVAMYMKLFENHPSAIAMDFGVRVALQGESSPSCRMC